MTEYTPQYFLLTWRLSGDEKRKEDGYFHDPADDIHAHFMETKLRDWYSVANEARRIYNLMFVDIEEENFVEDGSPLDGVWTGAAAQAADGVWAAVADALGLDKDILESALEDWYSPHGEVPPPMTMDDFMKRYKEHEQDWKEMGSA